MASRALSISEQVAQGKKLVESKIRGRSGARQGKYIAYFQNFTSSYGDSEKLLSKYREALSCKDIAGLAVATRPDCLNPAILRGLGEISRNRFVQIELGLQTSNEATGRLINRSYTNQDYIDAVHRIREAAPSIHIVTHLIFGLPGESEEDMLKSVKFVIEQNRHPELVSGSLWGIKITSLYILKNTSLATLYESDEYEPLTKEQYFALLQKALPLLPEACVVHRLTGDPPKAILLAPEWPKDKKRVLNELKNIGLQFIN